MAKPASDEAETNTCGNSSAALADTTPHDRRYDRLREYTEIVQQLLAGCCAISQGSTNELSAYTRMPWHPYFSLHRAGSTTAATYSESTDVDAGQVEKTVRGGVIGYAFTNPPSSPITVAGLLDKRRRHAPLVESTFR